MPTLLDMARLATPERLDGDSLAPAVRDRADPEERTLFSEARSRQRWLGPIERERWNPPLISVRTGDSKFIVHRPDRGAARAPVHFDLSEDALENTPHPVEGERLRALNELVDAYLAGSVAAEGSGENSLTSEQRENLRLLGYLE
jgi:arylsulfatase A-like enzyme